jgi:hypothetical protein
VALSADARTIVRASDENPLRMKHACCSNACGLQVDLEHAARKRDFKSTSLLKEDE